MPIVLSIKTAQDVAAKHNGKCLSIKYIDCRQNLLWQCEKIHQWRSSLNNIKNNNQWCPICSPKRREQTNIIRYGVPNPMQNIKIALMAAKSQNNSYVLYHWKTGEELVCQASWEKKVVEYFNENEINFRWQSRVFKMPNGKTYRPDCYLFSTKKWIEIKGYFRKDAKDKWNWFQTIKPNSELWDRVKLKSMGIL